MVEVCCSINFVFFLRANSEILHPLSFNSVFVFFFFLPRPQFFKIVSSASQQGSFSFSSQSDAWLCIHLSTLFFSLSEKVSGRLKPGSRSDSSGLEGKQRYGELALHAYVVRNMFVSKTDGAKEEGKREEANRRKSQASSRSCTLCGLYFS